jgi:hypothetical protein
MEPARITPTDLRPFKRRLVDHRRLQPSSAAHKLATLKSFPTWVAAADIAPGLPVPAQGQSWSDSRRRPDGQQGGDLQWGGQLQ